MTSLADALTSTGMIPPMGGADLQQPDAPANQNQQTKTSESDVVSKGLADIDEKLTKFGEMKPPEIIPYEKAPESKVSDPVQQGYVSAIGIMGAIASAFTRKPMVNSMNSAAAVLGAMKAGDQEAFKQNMEKWKIDNENIKNLNDFQHQAYKDILDNEKVDLNTRMAMLGAQASAFNDTAMQGIAQRRVEIDAQDLLDKREDAMRNYQLKKDGAQRAATEFNDKQGLFKEAVARHPEWTPEQKAQEYAKIMDPSVTAAGLRADVSGIGKKGLEAIIADPNSTDEQRDNAAKRLEEIGTSEKAGSIRGAQAMLISQYKKEHPDATTEDLEKFLVKYTGESAASRKIATMTVTMDAANGLLNKSLPLLIDRFKAVDNSQFTDLNSFENYYKQHTNDPNLVRLREAILTTDSDLALLIRRGGASTVDAQNRADKVMNDLMSTKSAEAFKQQVMLESSKAEGAMHEVEDKNFGDQEKEISEGQDFPLPPPEAIQQLKSSPSTAAHFDEVFGPGAAEKVLGK